jgi:hypothetical protein
MNTASFHPLTDRLKSGRRAHRAQPATGCALARERRREVI